MSEVYEGGGRLSSKWVSFIIWCPLLFRVLYYFIYYFKWVSFIISIISFLYYFLFLVNFIIVIEWASFIIIVYDYYYHVSRGRNDCCRYLYRLSSRPSLSGIVDWAYVGYASD